MIIQIEEICSRFHADSPQTPVPTEGNITISPEPTGKTVGKEQAATVVIGSAMAAGVPKSGALVPAGVKTRMRQGGRFETSLSSSSAPEQCCSYPVKVMRKNLRFVAMTFAISLLYFGSACAADISCSDLETATADQLLATITVPQRWYGGGFRAGKYDCHDFEGQNLCDWETTLEDDRMLDANHRALGVLSSHLTGSGSWWDVAVFGCVAGAVKPVYTGQFGRWSNSGLDSAPPELRAEIEDYANHLHNFSPLDCGKVLAELRTGKSARDIANDLNIRIGSIDGCRKTASRASPASATPPRGSSLPSSDDPNRQ